MTRNVVTAALLAFAGVALVLTAASPAAAAGAGLIERDGDPVVIVASGPAHVEAGRTVDDLWIGRGQAIVDGRVEGSIVVADGSVTIARGGFVGGDISVLSGGVDLRPDSVVRGDVQASEAIVVDDAAFIGGVATERSTLDAVRTAPAPLRSALWLLLTVAVLAVGLALTLGARATTEQVAVTARDWPLRSSLWGIAAVVMVPIVAAVAVLSVVGGLLALLLLAALGIALVLGLVATAVVLGRMISTDRARAVTAFLIGLAVIRLLAWIPGLFELVTVPAAIFGLGALFVSLREARITDTAADAVPARAVPADDQVDDDASDLSAWLDEPDQELFDEAIDLRPPTPAAPVPSSSAARPPQVFVTDPGPVTDPTLTATGTGPEVDAVPAGVPVTAVEAAEDADEWLTGLVEEAGRTREPTVVDVRPGAVNGHAPGPTGREAPHSRPMRSHRRRGALFGPDAAAREDDPVVVASVPVRPAPVDPQRRESDRIDNADPPGIRSWRTP